MLRNTNLFVIHGGRPDYNGCPTEIESLRMSGYVFVT